MPSPSDSCQPSIIKNCRGEECDGLGYGIIRMARPGLYSKAIYGATSGLDKPEVNVTEQKE
jgi:hypothetical protein